MEHTVVASGLTLHYGSTRALEDVGFALRPGTTGLLGPNGAGKTTLLRILATALLPRSGDLSILGYDPATPEGRLAVRRRLGFLPQNPGYYAHFTAFDFVDYVAILKEMSDRASRREEVRRVLEQVGLTADAGKRLRTLSGGMRQRVGLAAALIGDPPLLILDEPTVGLDPEQRLRFRELLAELGETRTVLLSTHQTEDVIMVCQQVVVLHQGRVRYDGTPADLTRLAHQRVWLSDARPERMLASWRAGDGRYRSIGDPPPDAELVEPTIEDGYLTLVEAHPAVTSR
ncbi:ABC transporter ATP-binding protein [Luedemannella helvata]|uniref:ABC transporter ATP-binding protein n=1 Tax=Luedemannella helvata TaxID=349315 RepID=A0ABP4XEL9_9ACTN